MIGLAVRGATRAPEHDVPPPEGPGQVDALARFGRLASIGQSTESICGELADLLSAVQARCDLAKVRVQGGVAEDIQHARDLASQCSEVVGRLLSFARGQSQRWSSDLRSVMDRVECELSLHHLAEVPVRIRLDDVRVACPPTQLEQVLFNLICFARDTIGGGDGTIEVRARACGEAVTIEVVHDGPGIPTTDRDALFEPFAAPQGSGLGLELYLARLIVEAHGGALGLFSVRDRGSTFRIVLPTVVEGA